MASKSYPANVLAQAAEVLAACKQIDPAMKAGMLTQAAFADELAQTQAIQGQLHALELQMTDLRNKRDQQLIHMWDVVKRARHRQRRVWRRLVRVRTCRRHARQRAQACRAPAGCLSAHPESVARWLR